MKTIVEEPKRVRTHQVGHSIAPNCAPLNVTRSYRPTEEDSSGDKLEAFSVHIRAAHGDNSGLAQSVLNSILNSTHEIGENDFDTSTSDLSGHFEEVDVCSEEDLDISTTSTDREPQEKGSISSDSFLFRPSPRKKLAFKQMREEVSDRSDCEDDGSPLLHSVSFYRKQQTHKVQYQQKSSDNTHFPYIDSPGLGDPQVEDDKPLIEEKIKKLNEEIHRQQQIISQTSQALNLCAATVEFSGSTESVEGERHLLVASHRRLAALSELQRIKVDKSLRSSDTSCERGSITVKGITLPLAQSYIRQMATETIPGHHLLCLLKYNETVLATQTIVTLPGLVGVKFSQDLHIPEVYADFKVTLEVYGMVAQREVLPHELKYHIFGKGPQSGKKFMGGTPLKRLRKPIIESPAGPQAVRSPAFNLYGSAIFSLKEIAKCTTWTLKRATLAPDLLDGVVHMNVVCQVNDSIEYRGFLTMFDEVSGFGAWHRRWCYLKGTTLNYWKYPDDEMKKMPIGSIDLHQCKSSKIDIVSRDICARLNTILLEVERPSTASDKESLILIRRGSKTIMRHLLSTDTKEEREQWMKNLNYVINLIKCWGSPE
ncbi:Anillin [Sergentomyia squamirostris]